MAGQGITPTLGDAVLVAAWRHIAEHGVESLSLRAVAREVGVTAPAIYRHFPSRNHLVARLVTDAFTVFGDAQLAARDAVPADDPVARLRRMGLAYRDWALDHPHHYRLIFTTVVPWSEPPDPEIAPAGMRAMAPLVGELDALRRAGRLRADALPGYAHPAVEEWDGPTFEGPAFTAALIIWARLHGLVALELAGHLAELPGGPDALFRFELDTTLRQFAKE
jgi:AcrR family transcriptional regulator